MSRVRIFSTLRPRDLEKLASRCLLRHYDTGETILKEGSIGLGLFIITSGRVEVFKTHDGRRIHLAVLGAGQVLGEMALLDDQPRSASAAALEVTDCLLLSRDRFRTLLKRRPRIAWPIVPTLARRVRDLQAQVLERAPESPGPSAGDTSAATTTPAAEPERGVVTPATELEDGAAPPTGFDDFDAGDSPGDGTSGPDVLRVPYALMMTGAVGFGESMRVCEIFFRSLDEESGLAGGRPMGDVLRELPASFATAGNNSWDLSRRLPSKLLETFRDHLRSDWRDEE